MPPEGHDDGLFLNRQDRRTGRLRPGRQIGNGGSRLPFCDRLRVDAVALRQRPQTLLTMLYRSTDRLCRCGAPMKNLAHSASFESLDKNAPSKAGTKHLVRSGTSSFQESEITNLRALASRVVELSDVQFCIRNPGTKTLTTCFQYDGDIATYENYGIPGHQIQKFQMEPCVGEVCRLK